MAYKDPAVRKLYALKYSQRPARRAYQRQYRDEHPQKKRNDVARYHDRIATGCCGYCDQPPMPGKKLCAVHLEKGRANNERQRRKHSARWAAEKKATRAARRSLGLCSLCGKPVKPGHSMCSVHLENQRTRNRKRHYGLTTEEWNTLFAEQNGLCAICFNPDPLDVDHDHRSKKVRGLLCQKCNKALGLFHDSLDVLRSALTYCEKFGVRDAG